MYKLKDNLVLSHSGRITKNIEVKNNILIIKDENDIITFDGNKWFINNISQGDGRFQYTINEKEIIDKSILDNVFEIEKEEKESE